MTLLRKLLTLLIVLAMILAGVLFALQNTALVPLDLLVYTFEAKSMSLWILGGFAIGCILGMLTASSIVLRMRAALRQANKQLAKTRAELDKIHGAGLTEGE